MFSDDVKLQMLKSSGGYCQASGCINKVHSVHHKFPDTKSNNKKYPLFINSIFNAIILCIDCHQNRISEFKIPERLVDEYETYLTNMKGKHE